MLTFTDRVIANIDEHIAQFPAERGGALLAMVGSNVVAGFEPDPTANVTSASYIPSTQLTKRVQWREMNEGLSFCGVVHSHPGGFDQPSAQDDVAFRKGLDLNPHLAGFVAPIVTHDVQNAHVRPDECLVGSGGSRPRARMRLYVAYRSDAVEPRRQFGVFGGGGEQKPKERANAQVQGDVRGGRDLSPVRHTYDRRTMAREDTTVLRDRAGLVRLKRASISIMPIDEEIQHLRQGLLQRFRLQTQHKAGTVSELRGQPFLNEVVRHDKGELQLLFPTSFPTTRPVLLVSHNTGGPMQMVEREHWSWSVNDVEQPGFLWRRLEKLFDDALEMRG